MDYNSYAKSLVKQYDKNGDNMLQADEQKELRGKPAESDLNKDGTITIDELVANLSAKSPAPASSAPASASSSSGGGDSAGKSGGSGGEGAGGLDGSKRVFTGSAGGSALASKDAEKRRTYRFTPAKERLPSGLPEFFKSKDTNGDGQVQMSEYSRTWSKSTVAEFRRYDLNDDGIITPKEAAKKP